MSCSFPKSRRVRTRREYHYIALQSTRHAGHWIIVDCRRNHHNSTRLGITASRHYGQAVQRNRFKRIVREAFRLCYDKLQSGIDLNVKPRTLAHSATTSDIIAELLSFFGKNDGRICRTQLATEKGC